MEQRGGKLCISCEKLRGEEKRGAEYQEKAYCAKQGDKMSSKSSRPPLAQKSINFSNTGASILSIEGVKKPVRNIKGSKKMGKPSDTSGNKEHPVAYNHARIKMLACVECGFAQPQEEVRGGVRTDCGVCGAKLMDLRTGLLADGTHLEEDKDLASSMPLFPTPLSATLEASDRADIKALKKSRRRRKGDRFSNIENRYGTKRISAFEKKSGRRSMEDLMIDLAPRWQRPLLVKERAFKMGLDDNADGSNFPKLRREGQRQHLLPILAKSATDGKPQNLGDRRSRKARSKGPYATRISGGMKKSKSSSKSPSTSLRRRRVKNTSKQKQFGQRRGPRTSTESGRKKLQKHIRNSRNVRRRRRRPARGSVRRSKSVDKVRPKPENHDSTRGRNSGGTFLTALCDSADEPRLEEREEGTLRAIRDRQKRRKCPNRSQSVPPRARGSRRSAWMGKPVLDSRRARIAAAKESREKIERAQRRKRRLRVKPKSATRSRNKNVPSRSSSSMTFLTQLDTPNRSTNFRQRQRKMRTKVSRTIHLAPGPRRAWTEAVENDPSSAIHLLEQL